MARISGQLLGPLSVAHYASESSKVQKSHNEDPFHALLSCAFCTLGDIIQETWEARELLPCNQTISIPSPRPRPQEITLTLFCLLPGSAAFSSPPLVHPLLCFLHGDTS